LSDAGSRIQQMPASDVLVHGPPSSAAARFPSRRVLFFEEQLGATCTRANSLRPMHPSQLRYWALAAVFELSFGLLAYLAAWDMFDSNDPLALYGAAMMGSLFLILALGSIAVVAADAWHGQRLRGLSRLQIRDRLQRESKAYRHVAKRSHLRSMTIGAAFFGLLCLFAIGVRLMANAGMIQIPQ
jgi:hypothetical protein